MSTDHAARLRRHGHGLRRRPARGDPRLRRGPGQRRREGGRGRRRARRARRDRRRRAARPPAVRRAAGLAVGPGRGEGPDPRRARSRAGPCRSVVRFLRVLNRHGRLGLVAADRPRGPGDLGPPAEPPAGPGPLGRPARRGASRTRSATGSAACSPRRPCLTIEVDPALIGGLVVQVGDDVYDASVRNRLEQLRHRLIEGKTHEIQSRRDHFSYPA